MVNKEWRRQDAGGGEGGVKKLSCSKRKYKKTLKDVEEKAVEINSGEKERKVVMWRKKK